MTVVPRLLVELVGWEPVDVFSEPEEHAALRRAAVTTATSAFGTRRPYGGSGTQLPWKPKGTR